MKTLSQAALIILFLVIALLLSSCTAATENPTAAETLASGPAISSASSLSPTPVPSPEATSESAAAPTPTSIPTANPTSNPTTAPAPKPSADSGKVSLAKGFYYIKLNDELKARITGFSYPKDDKDCLISYDDLRYIKLLHYDFTGSVHEGELIVNARLADEVMEIFFKLYQAKYPLASVRLVDDYGERADDNLSMAANNTSAFNYRYVSGTTTLSRHSYGAAIDINPLFNPYIVKDKVSPVNAADYVDRSRDFAGKIDHDDLCYKLMTGHGWKWGGDWSGDKDYQHFSKSIN